MSHVIHTSTGRRVVASEYRIENGGTLWFWDSKNDTGHYLAAHAWKSIDINSAMAEPASPRGAGGDPADNVNNLNF